MNTPNSPQKSAPRLRSTGPRTALGKQRSSRNALKNGVTSPKLLSESEVQCYLDFCNQMLEYYPGDHPVVRHHIEQLSRTRVLLMRIQDIIDSEYRSSRVIRDPFELACQRLSLSPQQIQSARERLSRDPQTGAWQIAEPNDPVWLEQLQLYEELEAYMDDYGSALPTSQAIAECLPTFCRYITQEASKRGQTLPEFLRIRMTPFWGVEREINYQRITADLEKLSPIYDPEKKYPRDENGKGPGIADIEVFALKRAMQWFHDQAKAYLKEADKPSQLPRVMKAIEQEGLEWIRPDPARLELLERYQTKREKQISTLIGQLEVLSDRYQHLLTHAPETDDEDLA